MIRYQIGVGKNARDHGNSRRASSLYSVTWSLEELSWLKRRSILVEKRTTLGSPADTAYHRVLQLYALC